MSAKTVKAKVGIQELIAALGAAANALPANMMRAERLLIGAEVLPDKEAWEARAAELHSQDHMIKKTRVDVPGVGISYLIRDQGPRVASGLFKGTPQGPRAEAALARKLEARAKRAAATGGAA